MTYGSVGVEPPFQAPSDFEVAMSLPANSNENLAPRSDVKLRDRKQTPSLRIPELLGTKARRLQRRLLVQDLSLKGAFWILDQFLGRPFMSALRIGPMIASLGPKVQRDHGIPIRRQLLDLLNLVFVHGGKPRTYYMTERYRAGGMRDAGDLVMRNETKHGLFKALNRLYRHAGECAPSLGDKVDFANWCAEVGIPHPQPIMVIEQGTIAWRGRSLNDLDQSLFVKRRRSRGTRGVATYRRSGIFRYLDDKRKSITLAQLFDELVRRSRSERLIVQPFLYNHPAIADLADEALIVLRLMTCLDENLQPELTNGYLRLMAKLEPNWEVRPIQEFIASIDLETGTLGQITGDKPECLSNWSDFHPITSDKLVGRSLPHWRDLAQLATHAHSMLPERVMIGWDIALTANGPVVLEGNSFADVLIPQRVFRKPLGQMRIGSLLNFHLDRLEAGLKRR